MLCLESGLPLPQPRILIIFQIYYFFTRYRFRVLFLLIISNIPRLKHLLRQPLRHHIQIQRRQNRVRTEGALDGNVLFETDIELDKIIRA